MNCYLPEQTPSHYPSLIVHLVAAQASMAFPGIFPLTKIFPFSASPPEITFHPWPVFHTLNFNDEEKKILNK